MAKGEIIILSENGEINTEMFGFKGKSCLETAAKTSFDLKKVGILSDLVNIEMKDLDEIVINDKNKKLNTEKEK